jgi:hypothetical protein
MIHWQLGHQREALRWYADTVKAVGQSATGNEDLRRLQEEAAALLGVSKRR